MSGRRGLSVGLHKIRTMPPPLPHPSALEGTEPITRANLARLRRLTWTNPHQKFRHALAAMGIVGGLALPTGYLIGGWGPVVATGVFLAATLLAMMGLTALFQWAILRSWGRKGGWVVGYFDPTASQIVHPSGDTWVLTDHMATHPGRGEAGPFRRRVFTHLATEADRLKVPIAMTTRAQHLADLYTVEMPGLRVIGRDKRSIRLRREPAGGSSTTSTAP